MVCMLERQPNQEGRGGLNSAAKKLEEERLLCDVPAFLQ